jgi:hypothetical protein
MIRFPSPIHCAAFMLATSQVVFAAPSDKTDLLRTAVVAWEAASLAGTFLSMCEDLKTDVVGRSDAEIKLLSGCGMFYETEKVAAAAEEGIRSGQIGFHNAKSKLSPEILEQAARDGFQKRYLDVLSQPRAIAPQPRPIAPSSDITGRWCWVSEKQASKEADAPPQATFNLTLKVIGKRVEGTHCAVAQGGNRIDCAVEGERTIVGQMKDGYALVTYTSVYTGAKGAARIVASKSGITWTPVDEVDSYLPEGIIDLKKCP